MAYQITYITYRTSPADAGRKGGFMLGIGIGHGNAVKRPGSSYKDRIFRKQIEEFNKTGGCIINTGEGYYIPNPSDPEDEKAYKKYMAKELKRARSILYKRMKMREAYEQLKEAEAARHHGIPVNHSRQAG